MFGKVIANTPFTTEAANGYFQNITGEAYQGDNSFLASLRALIAPRIRDGDRLKLCFITHSGSAEAIERIGAESAVRNMCRQCPIDAAGVVIIYNLKSSPEDNLAYLAAIEKKFEVARPAYHRLGKIKEFYRKSFNVDCYINPEKKSAILFVEHLNLNKLHYLQISILAFLPWYFNKDEGIDEDEMALVRSLKETTPDKYLACLEKLSVRYDFRTAKIKQLLSGFEVRAKRVEYERIQNRISECEREILRLNGIIGSLLTERNDCCVRLQGLESFIRNGGTSSEIMDYFLCNKKLVLESITNTSITFSVKDYLDYFDGEMAEQFIANKGSFVYIDDERHQYSYTNISDEQMEKLLREIFVEECPRLRIRICGAYTLDLNRPVVAIEHHNFGSEFQNYMPNPHINQYGCMGNYETIINNLLMNRDYISAIEQCVASCKSLNWGDVTVMRRFMQDMWRSGINKCYVELPDGRGVTPIEAIQWLEQQDNKSAEQK